MAASYDVFTMKAQGRYNHSAHHIVFYNVNQMAISIGTALDLTIFSEARNSKSSKSFSLRVYYAMSKIWLSGVRMIRLRGELLIRPIRNR